MTGSPLMRQPISAGAGVWMIGTNGVAHLYPDAPKPEAGHHSACHHWVSTTLDRSEGDVKEWCEGCQWQRRNGLV